MIRVQKQNLARICQGDILRDVEHIEYVQERNGVIEVSKVVFPLTIALTQDCDLLQDYKNRWARRRPSSHDKMLVSVLLAPIYNLEHLLKGEHLEHLGQAMQKIDKGTRTNNLRNNETPRYHFLEFPQDIQIVPSVIDFKHYFSANVEYLKRLKRAGFVCKVGDLYREDICQRFSSYLSRIGLP